MSEDVTALALAYDKSGYRCSKKHVIEDEEMTLALRPNGRPGQRKKEEP